mmetsp:Transcript_3657/g.6916  ORF Transcript_3657/g.6916 Transcript_3657/m.6916 type:complete len:1398 (+) Transcript_3657:250-4443(+)
MSLTQRQQQQDNVTQESYNNHEEEEGQEKIEQEKGNEERLSLQDRQQSILTESATSSNLPWSSSFPLSSNSGDGNGAMEDSSDIHAYGDKKISASSVTNGTGRGTNNTGENTTAVTAITNTTTSSSSSVSHGRPTYYDTCVTSVPISQRKQARDAALDEAELVLHVLLQGQQQYHSRDHPFMYHLGVVSKSGRISNGTSSGSKSRSSNQDCHFLDNFNLLGVVTSPTLLMEQYNTISGGKSSSSHPRVNSTLSHENGGDGGGGGVGSQSSTNYNSTAAGGIGGGSSSFFLDPSFFSSVSAMSTTLSKEIESINSTLSSYSKTYLGSMPLSSYNYFSGSDTAAANLDFETELNNVVNQVLLRSTNHSIYPYVFGEDIIKGQIPEDHLPKEIVDLDLSNVEAYLGKCGLLAEQLNLRDVSSSPPASSLLPNEDTNDGSQNNNEIEMEEEEDPTHFVPDVFFSPDFDLTDPTVFSSLLVEPKESGEEVDSGIGQGEVGEDGYGQDDIGGGDLDESIRIQNPIKFTQYLDAVELALLHQVRSKSSSFFRETNRFTELKSLIASSVEEVMALRNDLKQIREKSIADAEMIPIMDKRRKDTKFLKEVLDEVEYVVQVKSSIGEMIQNRDFLEAVERIHLARSLLNGTCTVKVDGEQRGKYILRKITALSKMQDQLTQYENLVVVDLSNDLVDTFLSWNSRNHDDLFMQMPPSSTTSISRTSKVKNTILALKKCGKLFTMAEIYREKLSETIRVTVVTTISECAADVAKGDAFITSSSATIVAIPEKGNKDSASIHEIAKPSIIEGVTTMSFNQFMECLDMIYENILTLLKGAAGVNKFCLEEGLSFKDDVTPDERSNCDISAGSRNSTSNYPSALSSGADISYRSISELLRIRKESHSLISFEEMRRLWDCCLAFTLQVEQISGQKAYVLRSTLLAQAKAFIERKHEANMSSLAATLDAERWIQCDVSAERQSSLDRLCSGRALSSTRDTSKLGLGLEQTEKQPFVVVEGKRYRVVWSCLSFIEMIMSNILCAAHFQALSANIVGKVAELLRLFNSRSTHLVLGAGAIHSSARLKSINAKHLAIVTQCVGVVQSILPHIRAALMSQLPSKQHTLLVDLDKIKKEYAEHHDKVLDKFVSIIGGIVEHSLAPKIAGTNFDQRCNEEKTNQMVECCPFIDGVITNTKKMHQVLHSLLPKEDLSDVFSRIFAHLDSNVPKIFLSMDSDDSVKFKIPQSLESKNRIVLELQTMATTLNSLEDVTPWDFGAMKFLARRLEIDSDHHGDDLPLEQESNGSEVVITSDDSIEDIVDESNPQKPKRLAEDMEITDSSFISSNGTIQNDSGRDTEKEEIIEEEKNCNERDDSVIPSLPLELPLEENNFSVQDDGNIANNENEDEKVSNDVINS